MKLVLPNTKFLSKVDMHVVPTNVCVCVSAFLIHQRRDRNHMNNENVYF